MTFVLSSNPLIPLMSFNTSISSMTALGIEVIKMTSVMILMSLMTFLSH